MSLLFQQKQLEMKEHRCIIYQLGESIELNSKFVQRVEQILQDFNYRIHEVTTWTTDGFYRETIELVNHYRKQGVATVGMECAALAACAQFRNVDLHRFYSQLIH